MLARLGSALILLGLITLVVFAVSYTSVPPDPTLVILGAGLSGLGLILRRRGAHSLPPDSGRFRTLRKVIGRQPPGDEG
jgi:hypothetical protein